MKIFSKLKLFIILFFGLIIYSDISAKTAFVDSAPPPPGFESLAMTQHLRVSVFFMNQFIGFSYIDLHQGNLTFQSPEYVISRLKGIKPNDEILKLLRQSLPLNIECYKNNFSALPHYCEKLKTNALYIIYQPKQETVYLYLASSYFIKPKQEDELDFIPYSTASWSYINKLGAAGSFSNDDLSSTIYPSLPNYYNIYSNNTWAYKNSSLVGNVSQNNGINDGQHFQIQNLYAEHIARDKVFTGGYILNSTSPFLQTQTIAGFGVKTTLDTVRNAENVLATPLVIFVPQASQVSIFRNEQLIFSEYVEAGYQRINTANFPDGGYELTIKIGSSNTIQRFFTKGFLLPPKQAPQFYMIGGYLTNGMLLNDDSYNFLPNVLNIPVLQTGISKRTSERTAIFGDILLNSHQALLDFGPIFFIGNSFVKTAALVTSKNNYGIYSMLNIQKNRLNMNLVAIKLCCEV